MKRAIAWIVGPAAALAAAALAWVLLAPEPQPSVVLKLDSVPSGASLFSGNEFLGAAPVRIRLRPGDLREFRLVKRDFSDGFVSIDADAFMPSESWSRWWARRRPLSRTLRVPLEPLPASAVALTSDPSGATVYLDGSRLGATPLFAERLPPGRHAFRLEHEDCSPDVFEMALRPGEESSAHRRLSSKMPAFYRDWIARQPGMVPRYTELIQYYTVAGDYENAAAVLRETYDVLKRPDAAAREEYFWMLEKIYARWFEYPEEGDMANMRRLCRELVSKACAEKVCDTAMIQKHIQAMDEYDRSGNRTK